MLKCTNLKKVKQIDILSRIIGFKHLFSLLEAKKK